MNDSKTAAPLIDPLVAQILEANSAALAHTTNTLIDSLTHQLDEERATVAAIRDRIESLLSGPWMPTSDAMRSALWPSEEMLRRGVEWTVKS